jgi:hypothetical protein
MLCGRLGVLCVFCKIAGAPQSLQLFKNRLLLCSSSDRKAAHTGVCPRTLLTVYAGPHPPRHRPRGPHWHEQEPPPAIRRVSLPRTPYNIPF